MKSLSEHILLINNLADRELGWYSLFANRKVMLEHPLGTSSLAERF